MENEKRQGLNEVEKGFIFGVALVVGGITIGKLAMKPQVEKLKGELVLALAKNQVLENMLQNGN